MFGELAGLRCAIYARFSCDRQRDTSIEDQVRRCSQYIEQGGGVVDPALVFTDFAISGATTDRPGFEALIKLVLAKQRALDVVVVEDLSRLTRDFADAGQLFKQLQYAQVRMLGVGDGIDTSARSSKLMFGFKALISDMYRDDLADKTLRGLKGRVLAGYSAGGLAYGYKTVHETTPDGRAIGSRIEIHEEEAAVVRRVFELYLAGRSLAVIAKALNDDKIPQPRARTKHECRGWIANSIRSILHNDRYTGAWSFNKRRWVRDPLTGKKRPQWREEKDIVRIDHPELRIIDPATWQAAQERASGVRDYYTRNADGTPKGRAVPGRKTKYLLSGLLVCEECGAPLIVVGTSDKTRAYRCGDHLKRGTCPSRVALRESVARERILKTIVEELQKRATADYLRRAAERRRKELEVEMGGQIRERTRKLEDLERKIANMLDFIAEDRKHAPQSARARLKELEADAAIERAAIRAAEAAKAPVGVPTVDEALAELQNLQDLVASDPIEAREAIRLRLRDGRMSVKLDRSSNQIWVRGELIPAGFKADFPNDIRRGNRVSSRSSGGAVWVDQTSEATVSMDIWFDQSLRAAA